MYNNLLIEGDPTIWVPSEPIDDVRLAQSDEPLKTAIVAPLAGTLLLSPRVAGSVVLFSQGPHGLIPSGFVPGPVTLGASYLYLPSVTGLTLAAPGYPLTPGTDLAELTGKITKAMSQGAFCTIAFDGGAVSGDLVLNGASLSFVALITTHTTVG